MKFRLRPGFQPKIEFLSMADNLLYHGGAVSNWESGRNIPSKEQYNKICASLESCGLQEPMPDYEDVIRPFEVNANVEFTDVWTFPSVRPYKGKHPAEKPLEILLLDFLQPNSPALKR